jgi:phosphoribosylpyrophosphate synthetase
MRSTPADYRRNSATSIADKLNVDFALFHKERKKASELTASTCAPNVPLSSSRIGADDDALVYHHTLV